MCDCRAAACPWCAERSCNRLAAACLCCAERSCLTAAPQPASARRGRTRARERSARHSRREMRSRREVRSRREARNRRGERIAHPKAGRAHRPGAARLHLRSRLPPRRAGASAPFPRCTGELLPVAISPTISPRSRCNLATTLTLSAPRLLCHEGGARGLASARVRPTSSDLRLCSNLRPSASCARARVSGRRGGGGAGWSCRSAGPRWRTTKGG